MSKLNAEVAALISSMKAEIAELKATIAAAQPVRKPSDMKIVVTEGIPSKSGNAWGTVEVTNVKTGEVTKMFLDKRHAAGKRSDGADQTVFYASFMKDNAPAAPAATETPAASSESAEITF